MKHYTYIDIEKLASKTRKQYPMLRFGQALMNALFSFDPELYKKIHGTKADCFYDDRCIDGDVGFRSTIYNELLEVNNFYG